MPISGSADRANQARTADADFALTGENRAGVARLVARPDGIPLAIDQAAPRAEALSVSQLLMPLKERLSLLAGGDQAAPAAGGHGAVELKFLAQDERRVFRLLPVFPALFTLEAAGAVAGQKAPRAVLHGWWTARSWPRRSPARMASPGTRCWNAADRLPPPRRSDPAHPGCRPGLAGLFAGG